MGRKGQESKREGKGKRKDCEERTATGWEEEGRRARGKEKNV